jgi:hypothetical protein
MNHTEKNKTEFSTDYSKIEIPSSLTSGTLKNVFKAAGKQPNTIPVEILELKAHKQYRTMRFLLAISAVLLAAVLVSAVPIFIRSCGKTTGSVQNVEITRPVHIGDWKDGTSLVIQLESGTYPIDWNGIYALKSDGTKITPLSLSESDGTAAFPMDQGPLNIYVPDIKGNVLQLLLSEK